MGETTDFRMIEYCGLVLADAVLARLPAAEGLM